MAKKLFDTKSAKNTAIPVTPIHLEVLLSRIHWLIMARWMFCLAIFAGTPLAKVFFPGVNVPLFLTFATVEVVLNSVYYFVEKKTRVMTLASWQVYLFGCVQLAFDYIILSLILYFSGNIWNPFAYVFVFHIIISCLLLPNNVALILCASAISFFLALSTLCQLNIIPYYIFPLTVAPYLQIKGTNMDFGVNVGAFLSVTFLTFYFTAHITFWLRIREELLRKALAEVRSLRDVKIQTIMHLAHDLKSPLAAVQSSAKLVIDGYAGAVGNKIGHMLDIIYRRSSNATDMVTEMFDLIKFDEQIERGDLKREEIRLDELVEDTVRSFGDSYHGKNIVWHKDVPKNIIVYMNLRQIEALLDNLITNAAKYSHDPANVYLRVRAKDRVLVLEVADNGIGIPLAERQKVLEDFYRSAEAKRMEKDGVGLGLAIVRRIVSVYQGVIFIEDGPNGTGTNFKIELSDVVGTAAELEDLIVENEKDKNDGLEDERPDIMRSENRRFFTPTLESPKMIDKKW